MVGVTTFSEGEVPKSPTLCGEIVLYEGVELRASTGVVAGLARRRVGWSIEEYDPGVPGVILDTAGGH